MILIGDTSGLVAALEVRHPDHEAARTVLAEAALTVVSPLVFLEIEHIVRRDFDSGVAGSVNDWLLTQEVSGRISVPALSSAHLIKARRVQDRYADLQLDLTDAVSVVLAAEYETEDVLTLDHKDFRAVTPLTGAPAFRLLPADR
ncbi:type II toxin-antitoxin system VapC family toxin [Nocardia sp. NPDC052566]|uniref:type II toxin-antitoxin system VapC family toxin n=1 Tax=Nocardia sp. NPDC052566 TaxID=3364330 RepID=UPI0037CA7C77